LVRASAVTCRWWVSTDNLFSDEQALQRWLYAPGWQRCAGSLVNVLLFGHRRQNFHDILSATHAKHRNLPIKRLLQSQTPQKWVITSVLALTEGPAAAIIVNTDGFLCRVADKKPAFGESDDSSQLIGF